ncbi:MAG TPA: OmpA family protein [Bryobacteraceae bacterium]|nr:OmpA family protein [Bryobacteraceae bacterium]
MRTIVLIALIALCACRTYRDYPRFPPAAPIVEPASHDSDPHNAPANPAVLADRPPTGSAVAETRTASPREVNIVVQELNAQLQDAFFDYDRSALTVNALAALRHDAALLLPILAEFPALTLIVEGHCDERGSAEYNLGLGDDRARRAADALQNLGVLASRIEILSYGKERPQCGVSAEPCWQRNRRVHLLLRTRSGS